MFPFFDSPRIMALLKSTCLSASQGPGGNRRLLSGSLNALNALPGSLLPFFLVDPVPHPNPLSNRTHCDSNVAVPLTPAPQGEGGTYHFPFAVALGWASLHRAY